MITQFLIRTACLVFIVGVRAFAAEGDAPKVFTRTIFLIRHGAYNAEEKGDPDQMNGLTPLGIAQARLVAARLRGLPVTFTSITSSSMTRARQTAAVIHESIPAPPVNASRLLRECTPRTRRDDVMAKEKPANLAAAEAQLNEAFAKYFIPAQDKDENDLLICHGNVIRYFVMKALGVETNAWLGLSLAHCSLTIIQVTTQGTFKVLAVGDVGHIPPNLQSGGTRVVEPQLVAP
jgi:serine/threonine-protein phosphatase PGAM5